MKRLQCRHLRVCLGVVSSILSPWGVSIKAATGFCMLCAALTSLSLGGGKAATSWSWQCAQRQSLPSPIPTCLPSTELKMHAASTSGVPPEIVHCFTVGQDGFEHIRRYSPLASAPQRIGTKTRSSSACDNKLVESVESETIGSSTSSSWTAGVKRENGNGNIHVPTEALILKSFIGLSGTSFTGEIRASSVLSSSCCFGGSGCGQVVACRFLHACEHNVAKQSGV